MNKFKFDGIIPLALFAIIASNVAILGTGSNALVMDQDRPSTRCRYSKAYSLLQVDCSKKELAELPRKLNSDIEVMVMTSNRIKELPQDSLSHYGSLAYLYLGENFIKDISNAIQDLKYLQVLDVSTNRITKLPPDLFQLKYLRKLYLADNTLTDNSFEVEVNSPLEYLDVAKNSLTKIPAIGQQPALAFLNLSYNEIGHVSVKDIAPFCSLKTLDLSAEKRVEFDPSTCECHQFYSWIKLRNINVMPYNFCNNDTLSSCSQIGFSNETMESYQRCLDLIEIQLASIRARSTWIIIACCIGAFLLCIAIALYCVHKRNKRRNEEQKNEQRLAVHNAKMELLNGNVPEQESSKS